jgi:hypothetical protein
MNTSAPNPDERLQVLLREGRPAVSVSATFQDRVWRRIEQLEREQPADSSNWFARFAAMILQPRVAGTLALAMMLVGAGIGAAQGSQAARRTAQDRYLAAIAPSHVR